MEKGRTRFSCLEICTITVAAVIIFYQLMIPPIVGLANNGDFWRVMKWGGIQYQTGKDEDHLFYYISRDYLIKPETQWRFYVSSEIILSQIGLLFNKLISKDGLFDLRVLGFIHSLFFLSSLFLILWVCRKASIPYRWGMCILFLLMFCDVGYIAYFNSFYAEPASLIFLLITVGFGLNIMIQDQPNIWSLLAFFRRALIHKCKTSE